MKFNRFVWHLSEIEAINSRLLMTEKIAGLYTQLKPNEAKIASYLLLGRLAPSYKGIEFNLALKTMIKIVAGAFNLSIDQVTRDYKKIGDLGDLAYRLADSRKDSPLSVNQVYKELLSVANQTGEGSVERKIHLMINLLTKAGPLEVKYLVRIPLGLIRLGFSELTILDAMSWILTGGKKLRPVFESGFNVRSDIGLIVEKIITARQSGLTTNQIADKIGHLKAQPGIPIRPALASRLSSLDDIIGKLGQHVLEPKYDGLRTQIHAWQDDSSGQDLLSLTSKIKVKIFSRNLEDISLMFPEISDSVRQLMDKEKIQGIILDGESIAYDPKTKIFFPFQETIKRKRKHSIVDTSRRLPVKTFVFDVLFYDTQDLLNQPLEVRRQKLTGFLNKPVGCLELTPQHKVSSTDQMKRWFSQYIDANLEGIMSKKLGSSYQAGSRNFSWVKFKPSALNSIEDTLDLLVLGWYQGKGKRNQFGIGAFLVGVYDKDNDRYLTVSKIGTGLTDDQWRDLYKRCQKLKVTTKPKNYQVDKGLFCDFWLKPSLVVEIKADEITKSPLHSSSYALRFPRLVKFRDDKDPTQATSLSELKMIFADRYKTVQSPR